MNNFNASRYLLIAVIALAGCIVVINIFYGKEYEDNIVDYRHGKTEETLIPGKPDTTARVIKRVFKRKGLLHTADSSGIKSFTDTIKAEDYSVVYKLDVLPESSIVDIDFAVTGRELTIFRTDTLREMRVDTLLMKNTGGDEAYCFAGGFIAAVVVGCLVLLLAR